jgi:hypothetical protein
VVQVEVSYGSDVQLNRTAIASAGGGRPQALGGSNPSLSALATKYLVYILQSERTARTYVGQTRDLAQRLRRHNEGMVPSTRPFRP